MREFAEFFHALAVSTSTAAKIAALRCYLAIATDRDAAWAVYFLAGGKPRQSVGARDAPVRSRVFGAETAVLPH